MLARGYEVRVPVNVQPGRGPAIEMHPIIATERSITPDGVRLALLECSAETTKRLADVTRYLTTGDVLGIYMGFFLLPIAAIDDVRVHSIAERAFTVCMAKREFAVR